MGEELVLRSTAPAKALEGAQPPFVGWVVSDPDGSCQRRTEDYIGGIIHFRECGANTVMQYTLGAT